MLLCQHLSQDPNACLWLRDTVTLGFYPHHQLKCCRALSPASSKPYTQLVTSASQKQALCHVHIVVFISIVITCNQLATIVEEKNLTDLWVKSLNNEFQLLQVFHWLNIYWIKCEVNGLPLEGLRNHIRQFVLLSIYDGIWLLIPRQIWQLQPMKHMSVHRFLDLTFKRTFCGTSLILISP